MKVIAKLNRIVALALASAWSMSAPAAEPYPSKTIRMIVPYGAGGGADIVARAVAQKIGESMGQQVVVDNRPGAAGNIGSELVARSLADGYTLLLVGPNHTTNVSLFSKLPFDPIKDFAAVSLLTAAPYILEVHPSVPVRNLKELIALARARPGALTYGSAGNGTPGHLAMEILKTRAKIDMVHVPYRSSPALLSELIGGQITVAFDNVLSSTQNVQSGRLRAIAVSGSRRAPALPAVPTVAESGLPGFDVTVWQGLLAPAGTPREIIARLQDEIAKGLRTPEMRERIAGMGAEVIASTPQDFAKFIALDIDKWSKVIKASGARID